MIVLIDLMQQFYHTSWMRLMHAVWAPMNPKYIAGFHGFSTNITPYWCCFVSPLDYHFNYSCPFHSVFFLLLCCYHTLLTHFRLPPPSLVQGTWWNKYLLKVLYLIFWASAEHPHLFRCWSISSVEFLGSSGMSLSFWIFRQQGGFLRCCVNPFIALPFDALRINTAKNQRLLVYRKLPS